MKLAGQRVEAGGMGALRPGKAATICALNDAVVMALGGEPVGPRYIDWNFVSSSKEWIDQARADWQDGVFNIYVLTWADTVARYRASNNQLMSNHLA